MSNEKKSEIRDRERERVRSDWKTTKQQQGEKNVLFESVDINNGKKANFFHCNNEKKIESVFISMMK